MSRRKASTGVAINFEKLRKVQDKSYRDADDLVSDDLECQSLITYERLCYEESDPRLN